MRLTAKKVLKMHTRIEKIDKWWIAEGTSIVEPYLRKYVLRKGNKL